MKHLLAVLLLRSGQIAFGAMLVVSAASTTNTELSLVNKDEFEIEAAEDSPLELLPRLVPQANDRQLKSLAEVGLPSCPLLPARLEQAMPIPEAYLLLACMVWPRPCSVLLEATSMGSAIQDGTLDSDHQKEPRVLPPRSSQENQPACLKANTGQEQAKLYVEEMAFARQFPSKKIRHHVRGYSQLANSSMFSTMILVLRATECDHNFLMRRAQIANDSWATSLKYDGQVANWGVAFAHSFIESLLLGKKLRPWTKRLLQADSKDIALVLGSNTGNEALYIAAGLGINTLGYDINCELVELSKHIASTWAPTAPVSFHCAGATHNDMSRAWIVYLDCTGWTADITLAVYAKLAAGLRSGAAVISWPADSEEVDVSKRLKRLGWEVVGRVRLKASWVFRGFPRLEIFTKTLVTDVNPASYEQAFTAEDRPGSEEDGDIAADEAKLFMASMGDFGGLEKQLGEGNFLEDSEFPSLPEPVPELKSKAGNSKVKGKARREL